MKSKEKIIAFVLVLILVSSTLGYAFSNLMMNKTTKTEEVVQEEVEESLGYVENLQKALNNAITNKNFVKQSSIDDLVKRNNAGDYSLSVALNILGTPVCVLESIDSYAITSYTDSDKIVEFLENIPTNTKYSDNSFIQLYWMKDTGEAIITWVSLDDMSEIKIIGLITSQYKNLSDVDVKQIKNSDDVINDVGISKTEMIEKYHPLDYRTQYKLLDCKFVTNLMTDEYTSTWSEYVLKNEYGYLHLNTKDDTYYMVYQSFTGFDNIPVYQEEKRTGIEEGITMEEFKAIIPDAVLYKKELTDNHTYISYVIKNSEENEDFYYFDFTDDVLVSTELAIKDE